MDFIKNMDAVGQACQQFIEPHPCFYNFASQIGPSMALLPQLTIDHQDLLITSRQSKVNRINLHFIRNKQSQTCIIYLHGLASYCIEGKFLISLLGNDLSLCLYDSRGHGRNKADLVTYGLLQAQQLFEVMNKVIAKGFKNIILWGRSMGAVTSLRVLQQYGDHPNIQKIRYVIADAPFVSFKKIAQEIVSQMIGLPSFLSGILCDAFVSRIKEKYRINLYQLDLSKIVTNIPVCFLFSSRDELMGVHHVESIEKGFSGKKELIDTLIGHNQQRPAEVIIKVLTKIRNILKKERRQSDYFKKKGLSIIKKDERCQDITLPMTPHCGNCNALKSNKPYIPRSIGIIEIGRKSKQNIQRLRQDEKQSTTFISRQPSSDVSYSAKIRDEIFSQRRRRVKFGSVNNL